jgi:hypothetical protein
MQAASHLISTESVMTTKIPERNWRLARGRVLHAWSKNHWIISHRLGPQGRQTQDASWAAAAVVDAPYVPRSPATAAAHVGPTRRQRAAENEWENEGGATQPRTLLPGYEDRDR